MHTFESVEFVPLSFNFSIQVWLVLEVVGIQVTVNKCAVRQRVVGVFLDFDVEAGVLCQVFVDVFQDVTVWDR